MYGQAAAAYHAAPVTWAQPTYAQPTHEYLGPAKVLNWTPTERELLDRVIPGDDWVDADRSRAIYQGMNEYEREDWDTDLWGQQLLRYELDDQRDELERDLTYAQDKKRAELDEVWEFYKKKTQYRYDDYKMPQSHGEYGDDYAEDSYKAEYTHYDKLDVRETMLRANQLWDADVLALRQAIREALEAEREAHRAEIAEIVARREAEIAALKKAVIDRRVQKRGDLAAINAALDAEVRSLIAQGNAEVERLNDMHQELVLTILEAVDYYGEEADIKLILTQAGEGGIDLYGQQDVKALYREDRQAELKQQRYSAGYTRPAYGY